MFKSINPMLEEVIAALVAMTILATAVAALFWVGTGISPWPHVVIAEIGACGFGLVLLIASSPMRHH